MKLKQKTIILILLIIFIYDFSYSQTMTGNKLVEHMREYEKAQRGQDYNFFNDGFFCGYVAGVAQALDNVFYRLPLGSNFRQLWAVVEKYVNENPEKWNESAVDLVVAALKKAFPLNK